MLQFVLKLVRVIEEWMELCSSAVLAFELLCMPPMSKSSALELELSSILISKSSTLELEI